MKLRILQYLRFKDGLVAIQKDYDWPTVPRAGERVAFEEDLEGGYYKIKEVFHELGARLVIARIETHNDSAMSSGLGHLRYMVDCLGFKIEHDQRDA